MRPVSSFLFMVFLFANITKTTFFQTEYIFVCMDTNSLVLSAPYCRTNMTVLIPSYHATLIANRRHLSNNFKRDYLRYLCFILILQSSDTELNPGPRNVKFPCGVCEKGCHWNQKAICCDNCEMWYHSKCLNMKDNVFLPYTYSENDMSFTCFNCGIPNFSTSLFEDVHSCNSSSRHSSCSLRSFNSSDISHPDSVSSCNIDNISRISKSTCSTSSDDVFIPACSSPTPKHKQKMRTNNIRVASLNIQSVTSPKKKASFWNFIDSVKCDIICGCETWLKPSIHDSEILPPHSPYNVYRKDRPDGYGGSMILISDKIISEPVDIETPCDIVFAKIDCINNEPLIIGSAYRPTNNDEKYANDLLNAISSVCSKYRNATIWITGDFNLPDIDWTTNSITGNQYKKCINNLFCSLEGELGLSQLVDIPTRGNNILDLFLTNRPQLLNRLSIVPGVSDHDAVFIDTNVCAPRKKQPSRPLYMWGKANETTIKSKCAALSTTILNIISNSKTPCINSLWETFRDGCNLIIKEEVPSRKSSQRFNQPWISRNVRRLTRSKRRWYSRAKKTNHIRDWEKYKDIKRQAQYACRRAHDKHVNDMLSDDCENPKVFWSYIKSRRKDCQGVSPLKKDGLTYCEPQAKANILNEQFSSVFTKEDLNNKPYLPPSSTPSMDRIKVTKKGVMKLLQGLKPHKSGGPDQIPARLLKLAASELTPGLTAFFQLSLDMGKIPNEWKSATVAPVFKKGNRSSPSNYRPISLTCITCKLLEHVIFSSIMTHFDSHHILSDCQHGFRKRRSCETQLIDTINDLAKNLNNNIQIDAILLDFSKAFDKVPHSRLLQKLDFYGIRDKLQLWIGDFLSSRTQRVVLDGLSSATAPVSSGVPQGSVLGPLLFLVYINDMPEQVKSKIRLFADDSLLYSEIKNEDDATNLQHDLNSLQEWERDWQMVFHPEKCEVIRITTKRNPITAHYSIHGITLSLTNAAKYLGVTITSDLSWNAHVNNITKKANSTLSFLRRNISPSPPAAKAKAYFTYVRPTLEYASTVWAPHTDNLIQQLEMTQRRAARFVKRDFQRTSSVTTMLENLKWNSLDHRRNLARVTMLYKIHHHLVDINYSESLHLATSSTRGHNLQFTQLSTRKSAYQHSFFPASIVLWNRLPANVVYQPTLDRFQSALGSVRNL